jgi:hypothetical protein
MDEDAITFGFLITAVAVFVTGMIWQDLWSLLFAMTMSGNLFYETIGIAGFILAFVGALVLLYCALILLAYIIIFAVIFGIPAYLIYLAMGLEYSIILAVIIGIIALVYLVETRTVEVQHYTIILNPHRRYIIKR